MVRNKPIKNFASIKHGYAFSSQYFSKDKQDYILLTPGNFHIDKKLYFGSNTKYYSGPIDSEYVLSNGDLLVVMTDLTKNMAILGNAVILHSELPVLHNQRIGLIDTSSDVSKEYLCYLINSESVKRCIKATASGTTVRHTSPSKILDIRAYLPPLPEQQKIAKILTTWDKAISTTERLIYNSKQQKKALMQQLLTGKKRLLDDEGKRLEGKWEDATVSSFGKVVTGNTPPKNDPNNYGGSISWATAEDFKQKYVSSTKVKLTDSGATKARIVPRGSVLVTCIASIGKNAIANEGLATNQQINSVVINKDNSNEFFYYLIEFNTHKLLAWAGTTAVPILNKTSFEKVKFTVPSLKEQQKIAAVLTNADKEIELLEQQLADLQQEKKALMQVLLTGKKRVRIDEIV
ncbi:MAG: restriction endonuclease subunit S [Psychrobacter celer]